MNNEEIRDLSSEGGIIGTLVFHPEYIFYSEQLRPEHFTHQEHAQIYKALESLAKGDIAKIDAYNIHSALTSMGVEPIMDVRRTMAYLDDCSIVARHTPEEYKLLVDIVLDKALRRDLHSALKHCEGYCYDKSGNDIRQNVYDEIDKLMVGYSATDDIPEFKDVADSLWEKITNRQTSENIGYEFKFPALREMVSIDREELVIFGAREKTGKSIMLLDCAVDLLNKGASVLYIDSELSSEQFMIRLLAHMTQIEYRRIKYGEYNDEENKRLNEAIQKMKTWKFTHKNVPIFDSKTIYTITKKVNHTQKLDVLIVDYFKINKDDGDAFQAYASGGALIDMVKNQLASSMNIAALGAVQLTRNGTVADSAKIARNCSTLILLQEKTAEEFENDGGEEFGTHKLVVSRNRNGVQHMDGEYIDLGFKGNFCTFYEAKQHKKVEPV